MDKRYNSIFQIYDTCEHCFKNCKTEGLGRLYCPNFSKKVEGSSLISDALKGAATAALFLLLTVGFAFAADGIPNLYNTTYPAINRGSWMQSQATTVQIEVSDKALTEKECIPSPWVLTDQRTGEKSGVVLDTLFTPGDDKGAGTCMYRVRFGDSEQWMVTFSQTERLKRQSEVK